MHQDSYKYIEKNNINEFSIESIMHWYESDYNEEGLVCLYDYLSNSNYHIAGKWLTDLS